MSATNEQILNLEHLAVDGCLMAPAETSLLIAEIRRLREAMRDSMNDKNANPDAINPLGMALGYTRDQYGDWIMPEIDPAAPVSSVATKGSK